MHLQIPITIPEIHYSLIDICLCILAICGLIAIIFVLLLLLKIKKAKDMMERTKRFIGAKDQIVLKKCPVCGNFYDERAFCEKCGYKKK
jgi:ribosomal protein L32